MSSDPLDTMSFSPGLVALKLGEKALSSGADIYKTAQANPDPASHASRNNAIGFFNRNDSVTVVQPRDDLKRTLGVATAVSFGAAAVAVGAALLVKKGSQRQSQSEEPTRSRVTVTRGTGTRRRNPVREGRRNAAAVDTDSESGEDG